MKEEEEVLGLLQWREMEVGEQELSAIKAFEDFAERNLEWILIFEAFGEGDG